MIRLLLACVGIALAVAAPAHAAPKAAIFPVELIDVSLEGEYVGPHADETHRLVLTTDELRRLVAREAGYEVLDLGAIAPEIAQLRAALQMQRVRDRPGTPRRRGDCHHGDRAEDLQSRAGLSPPRERCGQWQAYQGPPGRAARQHRRDPGCAASAGSRAALRVANEHRQRRHQLANSATMSCEHRGAFGPNPFARRPQMQHNSHGLCCTEAFPGRSASKNAQEEKAP